MVAQPRDKHLHSLTTIPLPIAGGQDFTPVDEAFILERFRVVDDYLRDLRERLRRDVEAQRERLRGAKKRLVERIEADLLRTTNESREQSFRLLSTVLTDVLRSLHRITAIRDDAEGKVRRGVVALVRQLSDVQDALESRVKDDISTAVDDVVERVWGEKNPQTGLATKVFGTAVVRQTRTPFPGPPRETEPPTRHPFPGPPQRPSPGEPKPTETPAVGATPGEAAPAETQQPMGEVSAFPTTGFPPLDGLIKAIELAVQVLSSAISPPEMQTAGRKLDTMGDRVRDLLSVFISDKRAPDDLRRLAESALYDEGPISWALSFLFSLMSIMAYGNAYIAPILDAVQQRRYAALPVKPPPESVLIPLYQRGLLRLNALNNVMKTLGYSPSVTSAFITAAQQPLDAKTVIEAWRRGIIRDRERSDWLRWTGIIGRQEKPLIEVTKKLAPEGNIVEAFLRRELRAREFYPLMRRLGYDANDAALIAETSRQVLPPFEVINAWRRGAISKRERDLFLAWAKVHPQQYEALLSASEAWPPLTDLIRMAVREVFTPDIRRDYGLDEDYPRGFTKLAETIGLNEEWARNYWAAHWELPSITQGFEMFHRGVISRRELITLLRTQDVMPFWRDKLIQIAYNPLTRVDIRRMYQVGVLDDDGVYKAYLDLGYAPEHARLLLKFTKELKRQQQQDNLAPEKDLAKSEILAAYEARMFNKAEAKAGLRALGYDAREAEVLVDLKDWAIAKAQRNRKLNIIEQRYVKGKIDRNEAIDQLNQLGLKGSEAIFYINEWDDKIEADVRTPTLADLRQFVRQNIISIDEFRQELLRIGYPLRWVQAYVESLRQEVSRGARR